jgi:virginiamycin B lyase
VGMQASLTTRGRVVVMAFVGGIVLVGSSTVAAEPGAAIRGPSGPTIREFAVPSGNSEPNDIVANPVDGAMWFTEQSTDQLGRITRTGRVTEVPIPGNSPIPTAITADPGGNLWFIEAGARVIARYSPFDGTFATYAPPNRNPQMSDVAIGPDGSVWFTEGTDNKVGRLDPATGAFVLFAMHKRNVWPQSITAGPDGNMWFTTVGSVGRITGDGTVTRFPVGDGVSPQLDGITVGSDGNLWFTEIYPDDMVGRVTTDGVLALFPLPSDASFLGAITGGQPATDPFLYVTDFSSDVLFRVRTDGTVRTIPIPTAGAAPMDIACGVDGRVWFTEWEAGQIGRLTP